MNPYIFVDPGHGGSDAGAVVSGVKEKDITLAVSRLLSTELIRQGFSVSFTRQGDTSVTLDARVAFANKVRANVFVSLHCNWAEIPEACGTQTYIYKFGGEAEKIAKLIQSRLEPENGVSKWERVEDENYFVLRETDMPAALIELGFLTNDIDRKQLVRPEVQAKFAKEICKALCEYYNVDYKEGATMVTGYKDEAQMSGWAKADIKAAKDLGIMRGDTSGNFRPKANLTREEAAVLAMNLYRAIKK